MNDEVNLVFKYRGITDLKSIGRVLDILDEKRLYVPSYKSLNDPFEGYITLLENESDEFKAAIKDVRVLALSTDCFSQLMWAHYANEYKGVCIGFHSFEGTTFSMDLRTVNYCPEPMWSTDLNPLPAFTTKQKEWSYEQEKRIVYTNANIGEYYEFKRSEIACIIVGYKISRRLKNYLKAKYTDYPMFEIMQQKDKYGLYLLSYKDNTIINSIKELETYIKKNKEKSL